jgi:hypothetical protein
VSLVSHILNGQLSELSTLVIEKDQLVFRLNVNEVRAHIERRAEQVRVCFEIFIT